MQGCILGRGGEFNFSVSSAVLLEQFLAIIKMVGFKKNSKRKWGEWGVGGVGPVITCKKKKSATEFCCGEWRINKRVWVCIQHIHGIKDIRVPACQPVSQNT